MNPAVKSAVERARSLGMKPYLIFDGLKGLIDNEIKAADDVDLSGILCRGGTVLRTARSKRFYDYEFRKQARQHLADRGIEKLLVVGGDGSFRALNQFYADFGVPFAGIPATIDNDIAVTDYCLGVDTASNVIANAVDSLRDTATSMRRAFVVEVMGRHCGYLAMVASLASGAEVCVVPEIEYNLDSITQRLKDRLAVERRSIFAIVAEGVKVGDYMTRMFNETLGVEARMTVLGHIQRGGAPTVYDRVMAYKFAVEAVDALHRGEGGKIVIYRSGSGFDLAPVQEVAEGKSEIDPALMDLCRPLSV
jgi:6-phosphofructokinase 1